MPWVGTKQLSPVVTSAVEGYACRVLCGVGQNSGSAALFTQLSTEKMDSCFLKELPAVPDAGHTTIHRTLWVLNNWYSQPLPLQCNHLS